MSPRGQPRPLAGFFVVAGVLATTALLVLAARSEREVELAREAQIEVSQGGMATHALPLAFVENQGQWDTPARFVARIRGATVRVEPDALVLQLTETPKWPSRASRAPPWRDGAAVPAHEEEGIARHGLIVRLAFEKTSPAAEIRPRNVVAGCFNYFLGSDAARWRTRVPGYGVVAYEGLQQGVDLVLREQDGTLEYDVCLEPGSDLQAVVIRCDGIDGLHLADDGSLVMSTALGPIVQQLPRTWELDAGGNERSVRCRYRLLDGHRYGFEVDGRDDARRLVIDPGLNWSTYLGGGFSDYPIAVQVAANGEIIVAGNTESADFPVTPGAFDVTADPVLHQDQFVTRLSADGAALVFSTFIGGEGGDGTSGIFVGDDESVTFCGSTTSPNYPTTTGAFQNTLIGTSDGLVGQLSASGDALLYATLIGGTNLGTASEVAHAVATRDDGTIVASIGTCGAPDFPVTADAIDPTHEPGPCDVALVVLGPSLTGAEQVVYSSYLFGGGFLHIAIEDGGSVLGVGAAAVSTFPTTPGAYDTTFSPILSAGADGIVCRLSADLKTILASTFLDARATDVAFAPEGGITLCATEYALELLSPGSYDPTPNGALDAFVGRMSCTLDAWQWGTLVGGFQNDFAFGVAVDPSGAAMVTGQTSSPNYPVTPGAFDTTFSGGTGDAFVSCLSADGSQLLYSSFLGNAGALSIEGNAIAATGIAGAVVVGDGATTTFPVTAGAFDTTFAGGFAGDGFVTSLSLGPAWQKVGAGLAGSSGLPKLSGAGSLLAGDPVTLTLVRGKSSGTATLVIGLGLLQLPFKGGTLVPTPDIVIGGLPLNAAGALALSAPWPAGIPSGITFCFQHWIPDAAGPSGFAASNGLLATTP
jgi:hypothetical protein